MGAGCSPCNKRRGGRGGAEWKRKRVIERRRMGEERVGAKKGVGELVKIKNELHVMFRIPRPAHQSMTYGDKTTCDTSGAGRG